MALRPTNVYRSLGEEFAYSVHTQLDAASLRRALLVTAGHSDDFATGADVEDRETAAAWTAVLPLGPEFEPADVSVRLDADSGAFWVLAEAASRWQAGDFARMIRRIRLPRESVDVGSARCWIEEDRLVLRADRLPQPTATLTRDCPKQKNANNKQKRPTPAAAVAAAVWPKSSLADSQQRHGCLVKDKSSGSAVHRSAAAPATKWTLDLALPEFQPSEVTVLRSAQEPGRLTVSARRATPAGEDVYRREVVPPVGVQLDQLVTRFGESGILRLEAPAVGLKSGRRGIVGIVGGGAGGAGAKIASLTRELRHHAGGGGGAASASSSASPPAAEAGATPRSRDCVVQ